MESQLASQPLKLQGKKHHYQQYSKTNSGTATRPKDKDDAQHDQNEGNTQTPTFMGFDNQPSFLLPRAVIPKINALPPSYGILLGCRYRSQSQ